MQQTFYRLTLAFALGIAGCAVAADLPAPAIATQVKAASGPVDSALAAAIKTGIAQVEAYFGRPFPRTFAVRVHVSRGELDKQWAADWKSPGFKSECWMVASGTGDVLDLLAPTAWAKEACEHNAADAEALQKLISHELVHVFHGQVNPSSDFSEVEGLDWFVEGLAVAASGQITNARDAEVRTALKDNKVPAGLDGFWKGRLRYGQSGSVVAWIDATYGRGTTLALMAMKTKPEALAKLKLGEAQLLAKWRESMLAKP